MASTERINNWDNLIATESKFREKETEQWVFRGVSDGSAGIKTTLERVADEFDVPGKQIPALEIELLIEFMRRYDLYGLEPRPVPGDTLDWLALMRHHGAPSRFIDFTYSIAAGARPRRRSPSSLVSRFPNNAVSVEASIQVRQAEGKRRGEDRTSQDRSVMERIAHVDLVFHCQRIDANELTEKSFAG